MPAWIPYTLLRLALLFGSLGLLLALGVDWWLAAIVATIVGLTVSYIFFPKLRDRVAIEFAEARERRATATPAQAGEITGEDESAEDAAVESSEGDRRTEA